MSISLLDQPKNLEGKKGKNSSPAHWSVNSVYGIQMLNWYVNMCLSLLAKGYVAGTFSWVFPNRNLDGSEGY